MDTRAAVHPSDQKSKDLTYFPPASSDKLPGGILNNLPSVLRTLTCPLVPSMKRALFSAIDLVHSRNSSSAKLSELKTKNRAGLRTILSCYSFAAWSTPHHASLVIVPHSNAREFHHKRCIYGVPFSLFTHHYSLSSSSLVTVNHSAKTTKHRSFSGFYHQHLVRSEAHDRQALKKAGFVTKPSRNPLSVARKRPSPQRSSISSTRHLYIVSNTFLEGHNTSGIHP